MSETNSELNTSITNNNSNYCVIFNIPETYRSKHLRNYFNELIEKKSFNCFHYRHRPQKIIIKSIEDSLNRKDIDIKRFCAIIDVKSEAIDDLFIKFHNKFWINENGCDLEIKCLVKRIKIIDDNCGNDCTQKTNDKTIDLLRKNIELYSCIDSRNRNKNIINKLKAKNTSKNIEFTENKDSLILTLSELKSLREFHPPIDIMPNGNVGTPSAVYLQLIRECRLPPIVISKLDLEFPKSMRKRIYSSVQFNYNNSKNPRIRSSVLKPEKCNNDLDLDLVKTRNGFIINENFTQFNDNYVKRDKESKRLKKNRDDSSSDGSDEDEEEEWDRYESLHEDVTQQERIKERLYEEEIELQWEKGGSGLVFYTDAQFWDLNDNKGDFDEKTADDWDIDMSSYRKNANADKEAIDLADIRREDQLRKGKRKFDKFVVKSLFDKSKSDSKIGSFERHTKGIGRTVMERQGWKSGDGLGKSITGIPEPITDFGQLPSDKRGFGYRGEKLNSFQFLKPKMKK